MRKSWKTPASPNTVDLLLLRFPFSDIEGAKLRPVLVLTPCNSHGDFIGAQVTSRLHHLPQLRLAHSDSELGELPSASILRPNKVFTLNKDFVVRRVGRLNGPSSSHALGVICKYLGCPCSDPSDTGGQ
jgi:mRNA interferase MazF